MRTGPEAQVMYLRIIGESLRRRAKSKLAMFAAVALGAGAASGLVMILLGVGDRMAAELRRNGANFELLPRGEPLNESDLPVLREKTFWKNQIVRVIPELRVEASGFIVVGRDPDPAWRIEGVPGVLAGISLGIAPGTVLDVGRTLAVTGTVATGGEEDEQIVVPLRVAQEIAGKPGSLSRILVSAVTKPETDEFREFLAKAKTFTPAEIERMTCTNYPSNVARDFGAVLNAEARVVRRVAETEGAILRKIETVVWVLALAAILASCLSVLAATTSAVMERRKEIGLLKALGATNSAVAALFIGEAALVGILGSLLGYAIGLASAKSMSQALFGNPVAGSLGVYLVTLAAAVAIVALGVAWPLRRASRLAPNVVLHEV
jgi:putative ABC transport system permease protein